MYHLSTCPRPRTHRVSSFQLPPFSSSMVLLQSPRLDKNSPFGESPSSHFYGYPRLLTYQIPLGILDITRNSDLCNSNLETGCPLQFFILFHSIVSSSAVYFLFPVFNGPSCCILLYKRVTLFASSVRSFSRSLGRSALVCDSEVTHSRRTARALVASIRE